MMNNNKNNEINNDTIGAIGIGAMIVFIALVLVAAVASAVIIQTGEKLQQNAQQTGSDTQREISGKITINIMIVNSPTEYMLLFESSPGSGVLDPAEINWQMSCDNAGYQYLSNSFAAAYTADGHGTATAVTTIDAGASYALVITASVGGQDCSPNGLGVNGEVTFWIHVNGGGSTYETLYITDTTEGALVI